MLTDEQLNDLMLRYASTLTAGGGLMVFARAVAELAEAAERERCIAECRAVAAAHQDQRGMYQAGREHGADACVRRLEGPNGPHQRETTA